MVEWAQATGTNKLSLPGQSSERERIQKSKTSCRPSFVEGEIEGGMHLL